MPLQYSPYEEPALAQTLVLGSFLTLLNTARAVGDQLASVGIIGELFVGLIYGAPLANILEENWEAAITAIGYIGLIVLVVEGGLCTDLAQARQNFGLSLITATVGIITPITLSLIILHFGFEFSLLQAFTSGAALSTTSLGTTFSIIQQAGFAPTRLGAVLTSAAVADDVVGLILLQVIISLGEYTTSQSSGNRQAYLLGWAVGRPLLASIAILVVSGALFQFIISPMYGYLLGKVSRNKGRESFHLLNLFTGILLVFAYTSVAYLSGTSLLLGAFIAGLILAGLQDKQAKLHPDMPNFRQTFEECLSQAQLYVLRPFFFASIGFAVPIKAMFRGGIIWKGLVFSALMLFAKLATGACLLAERLKKKAAKKLVPNRKPKKETKKKVASPSPANTPQISQATENTATPETFPPKTTTGKQTHKQTPSLLPVALLIGSAMVARGEIALLILNVAQHSAPELMPDDLFLISIWAALLCTLAGPISVGLIVKKMRKLGTILPPSWGLPLVVEAQPLPASNEGRPAT